MIRLSDICSITPNTIEFTILFRHRRQTPQNRNYFKNPHRRRNRLFRPANMISDLNRSLTLEYALGTNLPERIIHPGGHIRNYYTPAGRKTRKKVFDASNGVKARINQQL